jgi:hypothetical protein
MSKEMRRERNRITARESRERKATYILELEMEVRRLNERIARLENDTLCCNRHIMTIDDMLPYPPTMNPEHMGFFDD